MATLLIKFPDGAEQEQEFADALKVGRGDGNDLVLTEGGVSRNHARFFLEGEAVQVEDVGSSNGTFVDGERITGAVEVGPKSQVLIGDYEISLKVGLKPRPSVPGRKLKPSGSSTQAIKRQPVSNGGAAGGQRQTRVMPRVKAPAGAEGAGLAKRAKPSGNARVPTLRGLTGGVTGKNFSVTGVMTVGRVQGDIIIDDDSVSRRHAELELKGRAVLLRDLGSANGTTVNGAPVEGDATLADGDIVQFGVVEMMFESGAPARPTSRPGAPRRNVPAADGPPPDDTLESSGAVPNPGRKRLIIIASSVLAMLFLVVVVLSLREPPKPPPQPKGPKTGPVKAPEENSIDDLLAQCRTYSSPDLGTPNWEKAKAACGRIIELEPLHEDANRLLLHIDVERACEKALVEATEQLTNGREEESLFSFGRIKPDCPSYFLKALSASKEALAVVLKKSGEDCKSYASNGRWENALSRCEIYARFACQTMKAEDLYPPAGMRTRLDGPLRKDEWRPKDPLYLNFLKARTQLRPNDAPWLCPELPVFRPPTAAEDPAKKAREEFNKRFPDPGMGLALQLYFDGKFTEAPVPLQKIKENMSKATLHPLAEAMLKDIQYITNNFQNGQTQLQNDSPEKAEEPLRKALAADEKLVLGDKASLPDDQRRRELERRTSVVRRTAQEEMASTCLRKGRSLADRKDFRQSCRVWKLGFSFSKANNDLLKALTNVCTKRAGEALGSADSCEALKTVLDYAVDGDGYRQKTEAAMTEQGCAP